VKPEKERDFYRTLRQKMQRWLNSKKGKSNRWAEYLMFAPDLFYLMWKLSLDDRIPTREKAKLLAAIAYFISPVDIIPEALLGPAGYVDDIAVAAYVLNSFINKTDPEIVRSYWMGDTDILLVIQKILGAADRMIGQGLWRKIKRIANV
jgi:uncharacterized membrane protein YkvA (DUF1232 family)